MIFDLSALADQERAVVEEVLQQIEFPFASDPAWQAHVAEFGPHRIEMSDVGAKNSYNRFDLRIFLPFLGTYGIGRKRLKKNVGHELGHSDDIVHLVPNDLRAEALAVLDFDPSTPWAFRHRPRNYYDEPQECYARAFQFAYWPGPVPESWKKRALQLREWRTPDLYPKVPVRLEIQPRRKRKAA